MIKLVVYSAGAVASSLVAKNILVFNKRFSSACDSPFISGQCLSLETATKIAEGTVEAAKKNNFKPITVTVMDPGGHPIVIQRMDGCQGGAFPLYSQAKAYTAVTLGMSSRVFRDRYTPPGKNSPADKFGQMLSMVNITDGKVAPFPGGVLLRAPNKPDGSPGDIIGAVGVSGAAGDEDEFCALCGVQSVGLNIVTEPAQHSCTTYKKN